MSLLTVFVPPGGPGHIIDGNATYNARPFNGRMVVDVPQMFFRTKLLAGQQGLAWASENFEALEWLSKNDFIQTCDAFPGANRPAPVAPVVVDVAPVIVRLRAPEGTTSFSHNGEQFEVDASGVIKVEDHVAAILRSHGFRDAA